MWYINLIVALSNLIAIPYSMNITTNAKYCVYLPMFASFLYHLGETKHNLTGIYPFNKYATALLNIDRFFAILSGAYCCHAFITNYHQLNSIIGLIVFAFIMLMISERDLLLKFVNKKHLGNNMVKLLTVGYINYTISHCLWHFAAYNILVKIICY